MASTQTITEIATPKIDGDFPVDQNVIDSPLSAYYGLVPHSEPVKMWDDRNDLDSLKSQVILLLTPVRLTWDAGTVWLLPGSNVKNIYII
ncbi:hypothetical protein B7494_g2067 [Chlorociboria aeruginascens]|nr:hypothetical protein B7494_g2067 [Chlorociboria aeruginascens]